MIEYKLCPMSFSSDVGVRNCVKEKCAWWVDTKTRSQCAIAEGAILLDWIRRGYDK